MLNPIHLFITRSRVAQAGLEFSEDDVEPLIFLFLSPDAGIAATHPYPTLLKQTAYPLGCSLHGAGQKAGHLFELYKAWFRTLKVSSLNQPSLRAQCQQPVSVNRHCFRVKGMEH